MLNWVRNLLSGFDRTQAASERTATAMEDIADMVEQARDQLKAKLEAKTTKELPAKEKSK